MTTIRLMDLLDSETLAKVQEAMICDSPHQRVVEILEPHRQELLDKGVLVEYLAYYLEYIAKEWFAEAKS